MNEGPNIYQIDLDPIMPNDILITADVDGMDQYIRGEDIRPYWNYIDDNEGGFAEADGKYIVCVMHVASMQGGVVLYWDTDEEKLVHASDGSYCVAVARYQDNVYTLQLVENYMFKARFALSKVPFGTMDCFGETMQIEWEIPVDMNSITRYDRIKLHVSEDGFAAIINGRLFYRYTPEEA